MADYHFIKNKESDSIFWVDQTEMKGEFMFTFDKKKIFNLFADYPHNLSPNQKKTFDEENPYWVKFFADRQP
jgi:hypothetical protein